MQNQPRQGRNLPLTSFRVSPLCGYLSLGRTHTHDWRRGLQISCRSTAVVDVFEKLPT